MEVQRCPFAIDVDKKGITTLSEQGNIRPRYLRTFRGLVPLPRIVRTASRKGLIFKVGPEGFEPPTKGL
jgi:hypothetical protein